MPCRSSPETGDDLLFPGSQRGIPRFPAYTLPTPSTQVPTITTTHQPHTARIRDPLDTFNFQTSLLPHSAESTLNSPQVFTHFTDLLQLSNRSSAASSVEPSSPTNDNNRSYELKVVQQPLRARMCGFGDKDRRPATPPAIVQLIIKDSQGNEINVEPIDVSFFVLLTDLFSADGTRNMNTVVHPSMTAAALAAREREERDRSERERKGRRESTARVSSKTPTTTATRNLIGSLVANAAKLMGLPDQKANVIDGESNGDTQATTTVEEGKWGIYFVLQDLSVRTEGTFRLKFSFVDIQSEDGLKTVNSGASQVRAEIFSDIFTVYSAKNFPGMAESTELSRCFARQGIKIHVRRDAARRRISKSEETLTKGEEKPDSTAAVDDDEDGDDGSTGG